MLTHNAPEYVRISVKSLRKNTDEVDYELVVVDNASDKETIELIQKYEKSGLIDKLILSPTNTLFAGGNNIAARAASSKATHYLLLNSDIEVRDPYWLRDLLSIHESPGIAAYGIVEHAPIRVDGYCLLIDAASYRDRGGLDEGFQWWWAVTKLQAEMLADGLPVKGYRSHDDKIFHFGGKSGDAFKSAKGMNVPREEVISWFKGCKPTIVDEDPLWKRGARRLRHLLAKCIRKIVRSR